MHTTFAPTTAITATTLARMPLAVGRLLAVGLVLSSALALAALI